MIVFRPTVLCCLAAYLLCTPRPGLGESRGARFEQRPIDEKHGKVEVFDVDQDGRNDIMKMQSQGESLAWCRCEPDGRLAKHVVFRDRRFRADRMGVADLDGGDGTISEAEYPDLAIHTVLTVQRPGSPACDCLRAQLPQ